MASEEPDQYPHIRPRRVQLLLLSPTDAGPWGVSYRGQGHTLLLFLFFLKKGLFGWLGVYVAGHVQRISKEFQARVTLAGATSWQLSVRAQLRGTPAWTPWDEPRRACAQR